jgi:hypothetical protein
MASRSCFTTESRPLVPPLFFSGTTFQNKLRSAVQDNTEANKKVSFHYLYESTLPDKHLVHVQENVASFHDHPLDGQVFPEDILYNYAATRCLNIVFARVGGRVLTECFLFLRPRRAFAATDLQAEPCTKVIVYIEHTEVTGLLEKDMAVVSNKCSHMSVWSALNLFS